MYEDDNYELVPKGKLNDLRKENKELKDKIANLETSATNSQNQAGQDLKEEILMALREEYGKEQEKINQSLQQLKDLNKSTLDNVLSRTEQLDSKLEDMLTTLESLTQSLTKVVKDMPSQEMKKLNTSLTEIKKHFDSQIDDYQNQEKQEEKLRKIEHTVEDVDRFMKNLRVLLSYVKPSDMKIDLNNNNNIQQPNLQQSPQPPNPNNNQQFQGGNQ